MWWFEQDRAYTGRDLGLVLLGIAEVLPLCGDQDSWSNIGRSETFLISFGFTEYRSCIQPAGILHLTSMGDAWLMWTCSFGSVQALSDVSLTIPGEFIVVSKQVQKNS